MQENQIESTTPSSTDNGFLGNWIKQLYGEIIAIHHQSCAVRDRITEINRSIAHKYNVLEPAVALKGANIADVIRAIEQAKNKITELQQTVSQNDDKLLVLQKLIAQVKVNSELVFDFGKYKGRKICDVPASYLVYLFDNHYSRGDIDRYIQENYELLKLQASKE